MNDVISNRDLVDILINNVKDFSQIQPSIPENESVIRLKSILEGMVLGYKFITIREFSSIHYKLQYKVDEILGYSEEELTTESIYNSPKASVKITHPDDLIHKVRYDLLIYKVLTKNYIIKSFEDGFEMVFRVKHKNGNIITIRRSMYIFQVNDQGVPLSHIDLWEVIPNTSFTHVTASIISKNNPTANKDFYEMNVEELGINITERQHQILELKAQRKINKEIADILNIKEKTLDNHISRLMKTINDYCLNEKSINYTIYNTQDLLHFLRSFGLFPKPTASYKSHSYSL